MRIVRPTSEGDDLAAKREAVLKPRIIREFLTKYDRAPVPKDAIGQNVLMDMGVPLERTGEVLRLILDSAESVGFLQTIKDRKYVEIGDTIVPVEVSENEESDRDPDAAEPAHPASRQCASAARTDFKTVALSVTATDAKARKVFITHGKNEGVH